MTDLAQTTLLGPAGALASPAPSLGPPVVERHGDEFTIRWDDPPVALRLTTMREHGQGAVHAEVSITHAGGEIHWGSLNLVSTPAREALVKKLDQIARGVPWRAILDRACRLTVQAVRNSTPTITLRPRPSSGPRLLIEPMLPLGETTIIFGDGGAGKGYVACALALAARNGSALPGSIRATRRVGVLYLDYESVPEEIEERLYLLGRGLGMNGEGLHYRRPGRAVADEIPALRAEVSRLGVGLVIVDSAAPAAGPEPEGADAANQMMTALHSLGSDVTRLVIAHMTHASAQQRGGGARPFGSVFYWNLARSVWELRRSEEETNDLVVGLYHRKVNRGQLHPPIALRFTFGEEAISLHRSELGESPDLLARTSLSQRVRTVLARGARTAEEIAGEIDAGVNSVTRILRRLRAQGKVLMLEEGRKGHPGRWGLAAS